MSEPHKHFCAKCGQVYNCIDDRAIDASEHGGPAESVCFHHYGVPHIECLPAENGSKTIVLGSYSET